MGQQDIEGTIPAIGRPPSSAGVNRAPWEAEFFDGILRRWRPDQEDFARAAGPKFALSRADLMAIAQLRYELFIERDHKAYSGIDEHLRMFLEPVDDVSLNFLVSAGGDCKSAIRLTWADDAACDRQLMNIVTNSGLSHAQLQRAVLNSRMVVRGDVRSQASIVPMFRLIYKTGLLSGAQWCLVAARPSLERFHGDRNRTFRFRLWPCV